MTVKSLPTVEGSVAPDFAPCLEAFRENFQDGGELGAACAIYLHGQPVLDAWGGAVSGAPTLQWHREMVAPVFSVTKGIAALCVLVQVSRGALELDTPVAHYWPEFGAYGKKHVTVREALGHRAGVPVISGNITMDDLADPRIMSARLADESPVFEPGSAHLYHALTIGWITSELIWRTTGLSIGDWFREHLARPLGLNIQIGRRGGDSAPVTPVEVPEAYDTPALPPDLLPARAISLNGLFEPRMSGIAAAMSDPAFLRLELAGANGVADARSLARLYSAALGNNTAGIDDSPLISPSCIRDACEVISEGAQLGMDEPGPTWGAGLMLPWHVQPMLGPGSFGHDGAGGSLAFAHAPSGVSFAYVRNRTGKPAIVDPQVYRVVEALAGCLGMSIPQY